MTWEEREELERAAVRPLENMRGDGWSIAYVEDVNRYVARSKRLPTADEQAGDWGDVHISGPRLLHTKRSA